VAARAGVWLNEALLWGQGWLGLLLLWLSLILFSATLPWQNAEWGVSVPPYFWVAISGLLVGLFLSQMGGWALWWHGLGALTGAGITIGMVATTLPDGGWLERVGQVIARTRLWSVAAREGWSNNDLTVLVLLLTAVSWLLGYLGPWCVLVWKKAFILVLVGGVFILEGLYYIPQPASLLVIYLWASLMLVMQLSLTPRDNPSGLRPAHHLSLLAMAGLLVLVVWRVPLPQELLKGGDLWTKVPPWREIVRSSERLFPVLAISKSQDQAPNPNEVTFGNTLAFKGPIKRIGNVLFKVEVPRGSPAQGRWRASAYDVYTSQGWLSGEQSAPASKLETAEEASFQSRQEVTQTIELLVRSDLLVAAGQPLSASLSAAEAESPAPLVYTISLTSEPQEDQKLPADVEAAAAQLRQAASSGVLSASQISSSLPPGFKTVGLELKGSSIAAVKIQREPPAAADVTALRTPYLLRPPTEYTVTSSVSQATANELAASNAPLPDWVQEHYLALPPTLPQRVRQLAASIILTSEAHSAYAKTVAIQDYLRQLTYRQDIKAPPLDMDGVDYFLFISKAGYSEYFASAMVVMLRSMGVPARLAVGFVSDELDPENTDPEKTVYVVRDSHAHGWVEVFFPEYGWVDFEPTPGWQIELPFGGAPVGAINLTRDPLGDPEFEPEGAVPLGSPTDGSSSSLPAPGSPLAATASGSATGPQAGQPGGPTQTPPSASAAAVPGSSTAGAVAPSTTAALFSIALLGVVLSLLLALSLYVWRRSWSAKGDEGELYTKLCRLASWGHLRPQPWLTPLEYANLLVAALPSQGNAIHLIVETYGRWLYGKRGGSQEARQQLQGAWLSLRKELLKRIIRPW
jgi:transglutaminase-like putative cysteine protease